MELLVSSETQSMGAARQHAIVVSTLLDAITQLEGPQPISSVVLAGTFARDQELVAFLVESYPSIHIEREACNDVES